jgi:hypothetical protein
MTDPLERILIQSYRLNMMFIANIILALLRPKLKKAEKHYLDVDVPKLIELEAADYEAAVSHDSDAILEAQRNYDTYKRGIRDRMWKAQVSEARQELLKHLVYMSNPYFEKSLLNSSLKDVEQDVIDLRYNYRMLAPLRKMAKAVNAPPLVLEFLALLNEESFKLSQQRFRRKRE